MIANKTDLRDFILQKLGFPVVEINVSDEQIDLVIEEALEYCKEFHDDFTQRLYYKYTLTGTEITLSSNSAMAFQKGELVSYSGGTFKIYDMPAPNKLRTQRLGGTMQAGETITGNTSGFSTTVSANPVFIGDTENQYIVMPDGTETVTRVLPLRSVLNSYSALFDVKYQFVASDILNITRGNILYYHISMDYLAEVEFAYNPKPETVFNRYTQRLGMNFNWDVNTFPGQFVIIEGFFVVNPDVFYKVLNDRLFKELCVALLQKQWGMNTKKYSNVALPGGVTIRGEEMYQEGLEREQAVKEEIKRTFQSPPTFFMG